MQQGDERGLLRRSAISAGDYFIMRGEAEAAATFAAQKHFAFREENEKTALQETLFNRDSGLAEVIIPPRSGMIGTSVFQGMVTYSGDLIIMAI